MLKKRRDSGAATPLLISLTSDLCSWPILCHIPSHVFDRPLFIEEAQALIWLPSGNHRQSQINSLLNQLLASHQQKIERFLFG